MNTIIISLSVCFGIVITYGLIRLAKAYNDRQAKKAKRHRVSYADDIRNPENEEFVNEVAFNEDIEPAMVTQAMFNMRYGIE